MLNDHGKELVKVWLSVPTIVVVLTLTFLSALAIRRFDLNSGEIASWVQAFGSIAAIWFALALGRQQIESQVLSNKINLELKAGAFLAVFEGVAENTAKVSALAEKGLRISGFAIVWEMAYADIFKLNLTALRGIPAHELGRREFVVGHAKMLAYMLQMEVVIVDLIQLAADNKQLQVRWVDLKYKEIIELNASFQEAIESYKKSNV